MDNNDLEILELDRKVSSILWIQFGLKLTEAVLITKSYRLKPESEGEDFILFGVWIQTIGDFMTSLGVAKQVTAININHPLFVEGGKLSIKGNLTSAMGLVLQAIGGKIVLEEGIDVLIP
ncbi:hypothetical protein [Jeotgalibacillus proteolyticus]|uniref:Uncharacterized protein n=1 Tax=Jeotgalibacillus proteolyticus TaxID=2082395 RepID=A0A2S5G825_9BACL|nr:hypothetical protein [Jeotgalibacillus proteolyticus]PPA69071.1 hypothetical protein C4B60_17305 [Jeotgalibacillus proteolyticus]